MFPGAQSRGTDSPRLSPSLPECLAPFLVAEVSGFTNHGHGDALLAAVIDSILCLTLSPKERVGHIDLLPTPLQAAFPCP